MRKSLRSLLALLVSSCFILPLQAQTSKGSVLLGGGLSYSQNHSKSEYPQNNWNTSTYHNFGLSPMFGYFMANNLAIGTTLIWHTGRYASNDAIRSKNHTLGLNPYARYYKFLGEKIALFGQLGLGFSKTTEKRKSTSEDFQTSNTAENSFINLLPGISYFATPRLGFQLTLGQLQYSKTAQEYFIIIAPCQEGYWIK